MFTVKLGTGKTFSVTAAEERYSSGYYGNASGDQILLRLECANVAQPLGWYQQLLMEDGALDTVQVLAGSKVCLTVEGYNRILDLSQRLMVTGEKYLTVAIGKDLNGTGDTESEQV